MKFAILFTFFTLAACNSMPFDPELNEYWENFKKVFGKSYEASEESLRRLIWGQRVADIVRHNLKADMGVFSYKKGVNKYSDLTSEEFTKQMKGFKGRSNFVGGASAWLPPMNIALPEEVDWREKGYVTEIKDQAGCGSCWAFSSTGSLEGQHFKKTGKLVSLSEQNLVDCSQAEGNEGCNGGWMDQAFEYVKKNHGIDTEKAYPYDGVDEKCHFKKSKIGANCTGYVDIPRKDEAALRKAVATIGPISVAINAGRDFEAYKSGIYDPKECPGELDDLDHGVLVVGYGTADGKDYWIVKNSWGESFGEKGYIRMVRNKKNSCGIATEASYPLV